MAITLDQMADTLQTLFTAEADRAAEESGLIRRRRKITGAGFVQALVFGWLDDPAATIEDLGDELGVSKQGLDQRFDDRAADCLWRLVQAGTQRLLAAAPETIPLLRRFAGVVIDDCTSLGLPAELAGQFPGCGGSDPEAGRAGLKLLVRYEVTTGRFEAIERGAARDSERALVKRLPPVAPGSLRLADLGFFDLDELGEMTRRGIAWISRVPAPLDKEADDGTSEALADWLRRQRADRIDEPVRLGTRKHLDCRLAAVRLPRKVAQQRLRELKRRLKKKGRALSARQRVLCRWLVLITDLATDRFNIEEICILYRVRWQIELVFKRWKSLAGLGRSRGRRAYRVLCETYAKLLGCLVQHWGTLLRGGPLSRISAYRRAKQVRRFAARVAEALDDRAALLGVLERLAARLRRMPSPSKSRRRPSTRQSLFGARLKTQD
jgi:Transposase DDE domain